MSNQQQHAPESRSSESGQSPKERWAELASRANKVLSSFKTFRASFQSNKIYKSMVLDDIQEYRSHATAYAESLSDAKQSLSVTESEFELIWKQQRETAYKNKRGNGGTVAEAELQKVLVGADNYMEHVEAKALMYRLAEAREVALKIDGILNTQASYAKDERKRKQFVDDN